MNTITVVGWVPMSEILTTEAPNLRLMVEDFFAETMEEAATKARAEVMRQGGAWLGEDALAFSFGNDEWVIIEGHEPDEAVTDGLGRFNVTEIWASCKAALRM